MVEENKQEENKAFTEVAGSEALDNATDGKYIIAEAPRSLIDVD